MVTSPEKGKLDTVEATVLRNEEEESSGSEDDHDPHFEPVIHLPEIDIKTLEEDEEILWQHRGQLYRYDDAEQPGEWKQRGTGVVKLLKHKTHGYVRLLMRRDITLKVCANHYVLPNLELRKHGKSDRSWVWCTLADFADEEAKKETLAIRFKDTVICQDFHSHFEQAKVFMQEYQKKLLDAHSDKKGNAEGDADAVKEEDKDEKDLAKNVESLSLS